MNKGKSFEGFEVTMNEVRMSIKMYSTIGFGLILIGAAIILVHNTMANELLWKQYISLLGYSIKAHDKLLFNRLAKLIPSLLAMDKSFAIMVGIGFVPCFWLAIKFFKYRAIKQRMSEYIRGAQMVPVSWVQGKLLFKRKNIPIGEVKMLVKDETGHVFIIGKTRTGKSVLLKRVVSHLQTTGCKIIVYENKGDFLPAFFRPMIDKLFCPVDGRSLLWSIWNDIRTVMDIDQVICWGLIPQEPNKDQFWSNAAREVLRGGLYFLMRTTKGKVTNAQIYSFFTSGASNIASCIKQVPEGQTGYEMISDPESKQTQGVLSTLLNYISCLRYIKDQDGDFSIRDWIRQEGPGTLFLMNVSATKDVLKPLLTLMLEIASQELLSMPEDLKRRRYIILDEFGTLHPMNSIIELLTRGGGMGASVWVGTQDVGQIDQRYGNNLRKTIINSCGTKLILSVDESDTKEYLSNLISDIEISEVNDTNSMGINSFRDGKSITRSTRVKRLVLPSELDSLKVLTAILKLPAFPYTKIKIPIMKYSIKNEQLVMREELLLENLIKGDPALTPSIPDNGQSMPVEMSILPLSKNHDGTTSEVSHEIDID